MSERNYIDVSIQSVLGNLDPRSYGHQYTDYSLRIRLKLMGYNLSSIALYDGYTVYELQGLEFPYLYAEVFIALTKDQKKFFNTDKPFIRLTINSRYTGTKAEREKSCSSKVEDLTIRYGENSNGRPWTITFTEVVINNNRYKISGDRIDWDVLAKKELKLSSPQSSWGSSCYDNTDDLLYDAYDGDMESFWTHRT